MLRIDRCPGITIATLLALVSPLCAQEGETTPPQRTLDFETGKVTVQGDLATIDLPAGWTYLQARDARYVVETVWENPPDPSTLGLVGPPGFAEDDVDWAIIVSYEADGYVNDDDAASIDYADMLEEMKSGATEANAERKKRGYPTVDLLGWAEPPHYDSGEKKLYWAKSLAFEGTSEPTLNYEVRILGRRGVLVMQAVAATSQLSEVSKGSKEILTATAFAAGNRYQDFDSGIDKVAAYGIGGLIAGKVLLKAGLLKLLLKPLLIVGGLLIAGYAKLRGGKKNPVARRDRRAPTGA